MQNKPEDTRPWAIIIATLPIMPMYVLDIIPAIIRPMWPIEEYAIRDFISVWRKQIKAVIVAPVRATEDITAYKILTWGGNISDTRTRP